VQYCLKVHFYDTHTLHWLDYWSCCFQKTSIECLAQGAASQRYLPLPVALTRTDPLPNQEGAALTYPQYLATVRAQVSFAKEVHDMLESAAQNSSPGE